MRFRAICGRGFARICELIAAVGLERMGAPHVRHLTGPLREMRLSGRDGISRALYVATQGRRAGGAGVCEEDPADAAAERSNWR